jgi:hypothetical protein
MEIRMAEDRPKKTAEQRAAEALEVANRKVRNLEAKLGKLKGEVVDAEKELAAAKADRDYKAINPKLPHAVRDAHSVGPAAQVAGADDEPPTGAQADA